MLIVPDESRCSLRGAVALGDTCPEVPEIGEKRAFPEGMMQIRRRWAGGLPGFGWDNRRGARGGRGVGMFDDWVLWGNL